MEPFTLGPSGKAIVARWGDEEEREAKRKSSVWHRLIGPIREGENWSNYIIGYQSVKGMNYYGFGISDRENVLLRITMFFGNKDRGPALSITLFNKTIFDHQWEESRWLYKLLT